MQSRWSSFQIESLCCVDLCKSIFSYFWELSKGFILFQNRPVLFITMANKGLSCCPGQLHRSATSGWNLVPKPQPL